MSDPDFQLSTATSLDDLLAEFAQREITLWPVVAQPVSEQTLKSLRASKVNRFANSNSCLSARDTTESILQLVPTAEAGVASEIASRNVAATAVATVDHFVHAEILQRAASDLKTSIPVLVAVNSGAHFFGCRPGTEALQLALAVDLLPNLSLHGLSSELPFPGSSNRPVSVDSAISAMLGTAARLKQNRLQCEMLHLRSHSVIQPDTVPEGWHLSMPANEMFDEVEDTLSLPNASPFVANVVSRPSLEIAVLDCGRRMLAAASAVVLPNGIRLPVKQIDDFRCVVNVSESAAQGAAVELVIGQQLRVTPSNADGEF